MELTLVFGGLALAVAGQISVLVQGWRRAKDWWALRLARSDRRDQEVVEIDRLRWAATLLRRQARIQPIRDLAKLQTVGVALEAVTGHLELAEELLRAREADLTEDQLLVAQAIRVNATDEVSALGDLVLGHSSQRQHWLRLASANEDRYLWRGTPEFDPEEGSSK